MFSFKVRGGSCSTLQGYRKFDFQAKKLAKLERGTVQADNLTAETLLRTSERPFVPLFGELRADTALSWSCSQGKVASVQPFAEKDGPASSSTSAAACIWTSPIQQ